MTIELTVSEAPSVDLSLGETPTVGMSVDNIDIDVHLINANNLFATASVGATTGTPSVTVSKTLTDDTATFGFAFQNLKGETGATGATGAKGDKGDKGDTGEGVPSGGTDGQILVKDSSETSGTKWLSVDSELSATSTNAVQNKTVTENMVNMAVNASECLVIWKGLTV